MITKEILEAEICISSDGEICLAMIEPKADLPDMLIMRVMDEITENQEIGIPSLRDDETEVEYLLIQTDNIYTLTRVI